jgi:hypothetical protein
MSPATKKLSFLTLFLLLLAAALIVLGQVNMAAEDQELSFFEEILQETENHGPIADSDYDSAVFALAAHGKTRLVEKPAAIQTNYLTYRLLFLPDNRAPPFTAT